MIRRPASSLILALALQPPPVAPLHTRGAFLIQGGLLVDGTGTPARPADVLIRDGLIAAVGPRLAAGLDVRVIPARGRIVAPGFIDLHSHLDRQILDMPDAVTQVAQGITTALVGVDGGGPFPVGPFLQQLDAQPAALDVAAMVGHGAVRRVVLGEDFKRAARAEEVQAMAALVSRAMEEGAFGLSSGLEYDPGFYATTDELVALAREAASKGGFYASHIRNEADRVLEALGEAVEIGRRAKIPVHVSHLKLGTRGVWGRTEDALRILREGGRHVEVTADWYPYPYWSSTTYVLMPGGRNGEDRAGWAQGLEDVGGGANVLITEFPPDPSYAGHTLAEVARRRGQDPVDVLMDIVRRGNASILCSSMREEDLVAFLRDPLVMVASDGGIKVAHPRGAGTFPRVLARYVRDGRVLRLETAVNKMTALPARRLGLRDRGVVRQGLRADLVVLDHTTVADRATAADPQALPAGIEHVLVAGVPVITLGKPTGARPGRALRRPADRKGPGRSPF